MSESVRKDKSLSWLSAQPRAMARLCCSQGSQICLSAMSGLILDSFDTHTHTITHRHTHTHTHTNTDALSYTFTIIFHGENTRTNHTTTRLSVEDVECHGFWNDQWDAELSAMARRIGGAPFVDNPARLRVRQVTACWCRGDGLPRGGFGLRSCVHGQHWGIATIKHLGAAIQYNLQTLTDCCSTAMPEFARLDPGAMDSRCCNYSTARGSLSPTPRQDAQTSPVVTFPDSDLRQKLLPMCASIHQPRNRFFMSFVLQLSIFMCRRGWAELFSSA